MGSFIDKIIRYEITYVDCRVYELNLARPLVAVLPVRTGSDTYRRHPQLDVFEPELTGDDCDQSKESGDGRLVASREN